MCTVRSAVVSIQDGLDAGVTDYVLKPFEMDDLLERVADDLEKARR
jgi:DNA-binding response OmpR family regulator